MTDAMNCNLESQIFMQHLTIHQEEFTFSAGHFTIFSATEREHIHGHNYSLSITFNLEIKGHGLSFDYRFYKKKIQKLIEQLDRKMLLPTKSPYLLIREYGDYIIGTFNGKEIPFLKEDVQVLSLSNITIEELSSWFLTQLLQEKETFKAHGIHSLSINVYNGPGQSSGATIEL